MQVNVKVKEGERSRVQAYEGVCIARNGGGLNQSFTVRKISYGEGVERVFPLFSPNLDSIKVVRKGKVRRAKLYYLRDRRGKSARIAERVEAAPPRAPRPTPSKNFASGDTISNAVPGAAFFVGGGAGAGLSPAAAPAAPRCRPPCDRGRSRRAAGRRGHR